MAARYSASENSQSPSWVRWMPFKVRSDPGSRIASSVAVNTSAKPTCCSRATSRIASTYRLIRALLRSAAATCAMFSLAMGETSTIRGADLPLIRLRLQPGDVRGKCLAECVEPRLAGKRLVESERREDDVRLLVLQVLLGVGEVGRPRLEVDRVGRPGQVADDQLMPGIALLQEGLEVAELLRAFQQRVADQRDPVSRLRASVAALSVAAWWLRDGGPSARRWRTSGNPQSTAGAGVSSTMCFASFGLTCAGFAVPPAAGSMAFGSW